LALYQIAIAVKSNEQSTAQGADPFSCPDAGQPPCRPQASASPYSFFPLLVAQSTRPISLHHHAPWQNVISFICSIGARATTLLVYCRDPAAANSQTQTSSRSCALMFRIAPRSFLVSAVAGLSATALICTGTRLAGLVSMITADRPRAAHPTTVRVPMSSSFIVISSSNQTTQCVTEKLFESRWRLRGFPCRPTFARQRTLNSVADASGTTRNQRTTGLHVARFSVIVRDGLPPAVRCFVPRTPPV